MNEVKQKKLIALNEILNGYEVFRGGLKSKLEAEINALEFKMSAEEFERIKTAFNNYKSYLFNIIADSRRVRVVLDTPETSKIENVENE